MNQTAQAQLRLIHRVLDVLTSIGVSAWLFGGWGLDARIGRITRSHGDVEFWVERSDIAGSKAALVNAGSTALSTQPPEESCEFVWRDVAFSTAYFDRQAKRAVCASRPMVGLGVSRRLVRRRARVPKRS